MKRFLKKSLFLLFTGILILGMFPTQLTTTQINPSSSSPHVGPLTGASYLIITIDEFVDELEPLALWKNQKRMSTDIITLTEIRNTYSGWDDSEKIKNCIIDYYTNQDTHEVLLAGDHEHVPSRDAYVDEGYSYDGDFVYCDLYYADLDNNWDLDGDHLYGENNGDDEFDYYSEVFVGRLSANDESEMAMLVNRILSYEKRPPVGDWMETAVFAGNIMSYDTDWDGDDIIDLPKADTNRLYNYIANSSVDNDWTVHLLAETEGLDPSSYPYTESLNKNNFRDRLLEGSSIMSMFGHSSPQETLRHVWTHDDDGDGVFDPADDIKENYLLINASDNELVTDSGKYSMAYLAGCSLGNFTEEEDCIAEYFLKTVSIGSIGSSQISWFHDNVSATELEFGGWYSDGLCYRFWEQLHNYNNPAIALALARQDYIQDRGTYGVTEWYHVPIWEEKVLKQANYFGDPSLEIWMEIPEQIDVTWEYRDSGLGYDITVTANSEILPNADVTLSNDTDVIWQGQTHSNGMAFPEYDPSTQTEDELTLTITEHTYLPSILTVPLSPSKAIPGFSTLIIVLVSFSSVCIISGLLKRKIKN